MTKYIWKFGLIGGAVLAGLMLAALPLENVIGYDRAVLVGYGTMVLGFLFVFLGIRAYREDVGGGTVTFWRAFALGLAITAVGSTCYTLAWEAYFFGTKSDFTAKYAAHEIARARASGASAADVAALTQEMHDFGEKYQNPVYNAAVTFLEPLPVGLLIALVSAAALRRRSPS